MTIEDIKRRVGIVELLEFFGADVDPYYHSGWHAMRCPFHEDRVESASVNVGSDRFRCHGCDVGGDVIDVVRLSQNLNSTREALDWISEVLLT